jgi:hypothetical protein
MPRVDDATYCEWVARRAVARAALHLGIEDMTEEALHVLSTCLLDYLGRVGALTAAHAEASGRSTSHCNVLDAIRAVELCTAPSAIHAGQVESSTTNGEEEEPVDETAMPAETAVAAGTTTDSTTTTTNGDNGSANPNARTKHPVNSWKSLAQFCFGVDWDQQPPHGGPNSSLSSSANAAAAMSGGGRGIGSKGAAVIDHDAVVATLRKKGGWSAPFPEEIPIFPIRKSSLTSSSSRLEEEMPPLHSSPAAATTTTASSKDDDDGDAKMASADDDDNDADDAEDLETFIEQRELKMWGVLLDAATATTAPATVATVATSTAKDQKVDPKDENVTNKKRSHAQITASDPFMPQYYPPLPSTKSTKKIAKVVTTTSDHHLAATAALSRSSGQDEEDNDDDATAAATTTTTTTDQTALLSVRAALVVRSGRPAKPPEPKVVVPVSRHSSAPVSRILEGSMDPSQP